jgi:hypothetical protein
VRSENVELDLDATRIEQFATRRKPAAQLNLALDTQHAPMLPLDALARSWPRRIIGGDRSRAPCGGDESQPSRVLPRRASPFAGESARIGVADNRDFHRALIERPPSPQRSHRSGRCM